jgi:hypothetical protein
MSKLVDTQLVLLSNAAQREDRMVVPPGHLKGPAATKVLKPLLRSRFVEEVPPGWPITGRPDAGRSPAGDGKGLSVSGVEPKGRRPSKPPRRVEGLAKSEPKKRPKPSRLRRARAWIGGERRQVRRPLAADSGGAARREQALLIEMLQTKRGANIDAIVKATGWLPHTGRAMISGLRKAGYRIEVERAEGKKAIYRIVAGPKKVVKARR